MYCMNAKKYKLSIYGLFAVANVILILMIFLDEYLDLPNLILKAPQTPINYTEIYLEIGYILVVSVFSFALLKLIITRQLNSEAKVKKLSEEKDLLMREIHHRVKNNLSTLANIIVLQQLSSNDENIKKQFIYLENRVNTIADLYEVLNRSSKNYRDVDIDGYLSSVTEHLSLLNNVKVKIESKFESLVLPINTATSLAMVITEIITNIFKHAFDGIDNPFINVIGEYEANMYKIVVMNNGKKIPEEYNDFIKSPSLGLKLVNSLLKNINGSYSLINTAELATIQIKFPVDK